MSKKDDPVANAMEGAASIIGKGLFAAAAGTTAFIAKKLQVAPEEQLRKLGSPPIWGEEVVGVPCTSCETINEADAEICFHCGNRIANLDESESNTSNQNAAITVDQVKSKLKSIKLPDGWQW